MWWMREGRRPSALPQFTARAQAFVEQSLLERKPLVSLRLREIAWLHQATSTPPGGRSISRGSRVRWGHRMRRWLRQELLSSDQLLELQRVAALIEGHLGAKRPQEVRLGAQARLASQVGIHAFAEVTGSSLLRGATPYRCQAGGVKLRVPLCRYGSQSG